MTDGRATAYSDREHEFTFAKKRCNIFTPFSILVPQGDPMYQSSPVWVITYSNASFIKLPSFVPFWKPVYEIGEIGPICCQSSSISLTAWPTDTHRHKKTVNDIAENV